MHRFVLRLFDASPYVYLKQLQPVCKVRIHCYPDTHLTFYFSFSFLLQIIDYLRYANLLRNKFNIRII
jgi:hypothetical protein